MNEEIRILIEALRRGQYEDPAEKIGLLSAALREHQADLPLLLSVLRAPQIPLRLAALDACRDRNEPELVWLRCRPQTPLSAPPAWAKPNWVARSRNSSSVSLHACSVST